MTEAEAVEVPAVEGALEDDSKVPALEAVNAEVVNDAAPEPVEEAESDEEVELVDAQETEESVNVEVVTETAPESVAETDPMEEAVPEPLENADAVEETISEPLAEAEPETADTSEVVGFGHRRVV